jgi:hypothetical protein
MLIDAFDEDWLDILCQRAAELPASQGMYLLLDGAFVPRLHQRLGKERKEILFALFSGCTEDAKHVSPFLTPFTPDDKVLKRVLMHCNRWPMVSVITTDEPMEQLAGRLAAWCVVEADGQRFNFRFPDTRRLPAIFKALTPAQRAQIIGPAMCWQLIDRDGRWRELEIGNPVKGIVTQPELNERQFALLVSDSKSDEMLMLLADRGAKVFCKPSRSHALIMIALRVAHAAQLPDDTLLDWCAWFWSQDHLHDDATGLSILQKWRIDFSTVN